MTAPDNAAPAVPPANASAARVPGAPLERLFGELGDRTSVKAVYGEPVTTGDVTVVPVAEVSFGFGGVGHGAGAAVGGEGGMGGGGSARPRGFIEIKNGSATYKPLRKPWLDVAVPLAALVVGIAVPHLARRLAELRRGSAGRRG